MLKVLIKSRFQSLFYSMFKANKKKKVRSTSLLKGIGIGVLAIYVIGSIMFALGSLFYTLCEPMIEYDLTWLYFAMVGIVAFGLCFIGSVFTTQTQLYDAKDNELLLSMPIPSSYILASRIIMLLGLNYMYEALVIIPAIVVYCMVSSVTVLGILFFFVGFLLLPFLSMTLSCIIGWLVALITARMRNKTIITMVLSLGFLGAYFYLYSKMSQYMQTIVDRLKDIAEGVRRAFYPFYQLGVAVADHNWLSLLLYAMCALIPFALLYILLSKSFVRITTTKRGASRVVYKEKQLQVNSPKGALIRKELKHFTSNAMYMMNAALGVAFLVIGAIVFLFKQNTLLLELNKVNDFKEFFIPIVIVVISGITAMNFISAPSISLEGKNLWIAQSIPVRTIDILMAKVDMHLIICIPPVLFASIVSVIVIRPDLFSAILLFLVPIMFTIFSALFGLVLNLKFPKFNWTNEIVAVKQSLSSILTMFGSMAIVILPIILYITLFVDVLAVETYMWLVSVVLAIICLGLYEYIKRRGTRIFMELTN